MKNYTHVLYHGNCYDGFGAAWAAWEALGYETAYIPVLFGQDPPELPSDADVLICDFSYDRETLEALKGRVRSLRVIDHHKTAQAALEGLDYAEFDLNHSGAWLTWVHFHGEPVPRFVQYLEDRDLWRFEMPRSKGISQALRGYPMRFEVWDDFLVGDTLYHEAPTIERFTKQAVSLICDQSRILWVYGYAVPVANATSFFSEVADELIRRHPEAAFGAYYLDRADGLRQWGVRSRSTFDVSAVAKAMGGGGHPQAAGWTEPIPCEPLP